jgi:hypothetical protein
MINLRMLAIAGALLLLFPIAALADPASTIVEAGADVAGEITDIVIADPAYNGTPMSGVLGGEQLVEGHTTFVTLEMVTEVQPLEGNLTIDGFARCEHHGELTYSWWNGIPYPTTVGGVNAECHVGERVVVTPTLYCTLTGPPDCSVAPGAWTPAMRPTGDIIPFGTPTGERAYAEELTFVVDGRDYYAWVVPVLDPWTGVDGGTKNIRAPLPLDRLADMGLDDFRVVWETQVKRA